MFFQPEASPQQAESLAAGVRPIHTNLTVRLLANIKTTQVFHLSPFSQNKKARVHDPCLIQFSYKIQQLIENQLILRWHWLGKNIRGRLTQHGSGNVVPIVHDHFANVVGQGF